MTFPADSRNTFQCIAEAISAVLGLDVEITDRDLNIIAGTGIYRQRIGGQETPGFLYSKVLEARVPFIVDNPVANLDYDPSSRRGDCQEEIEICCPIVNKDRIYGVIGLVGFDHETRRAAMERQEQLLSFLEYMALLIANKIEREEFVYETFYLKNRLETVIELFTDGVVTTDQQGMIDFCNSRAAEILGRRKQDIIGQPVAKLLPNSSVLSCLETGEEYLDREERHELADTTLHLVASTKPIKINRQVVGAVCSFKKIADIKKMLYNLSEQQTAGFEEITGNSRAIWRAKERAARIAESDSTVLILGESGTGKELFARAIHQASGRRHGPFVAINCGGLPASLLESELFGYEGGAFTGAKKGGKIGRLELADGGTLFLDEIGDMPLHLQVKLLRVLQERAVERIGGIRSIPIDVRIISATNRDLEKMVEAHTFRDDLYYRLNVIPLTIPPLRERTEDIPLLISHFLTIFNQRLHKRIQGVEPEALQALMNYSWPGNVRELENAMEYAVNLESDNVIHLESLPPRVREPRTGGRDLKAMVREYERRLIEEALEQFNHSANRVESRQQAARYLNVGIATLYRKIREYKLEA